MIQPKEIIRVGIILFVITALSALLLALGNYITSPLIAENGRINTEKSMQTVFADAASFEKTDYAAKSVVEAYIAKDSANETIGACVITEQNGYGGAVKVLTGVDKDGKITGVEILSHSETPGLGAEATKPEFKVQFEGKTKNIGVSRGKASGNEIDALSGATITSKAVTNAVNLAVDSAEQLLSQVQ